MIRLLRFLITGYWTEPPDTSHHHTWEVIEDFPVHGPSPFDQQLYIVAKVFIMKCSECGEITSRKIAY